MQISDSETIKQPWQARFQSLPDLLDVHERNVSDSPLNPAVIGPMQPASLGSLFLVDPLLLPNAADGTAKTDADVERHHLPSWRYAVDAYTPDESHTYISLDSWPLAIHH